MVNKVNVQKAIDVMQRVVDEKRAFNMRTWRGVNNGGAVSSEQGLHECGTAACFGGWLAVSPEWKADGGSHTDTGSPLVADDTGIHKVGVTAVSVWLGITRRLGAALLAYRGEQLPGHPGDITYRFYGVDDVCDITAQQVLDRLIELRDKGYCEVVERLR